MNNFDLRKFLVENKLTTNSRMLNKNVKRNEEQVLSSFSDPEAGITLKDMQNFVTNNSGTYVYNYFEPVDGIDEEMEVTPEQALAIVKAMNGKGEIPDPLPQGYDARLYFRSTNSKILSELKTYSINMDDEEAFEIHQDLQNEYIVPEDDFPEADIESILDIIMQKGTELFNITIEGVDPSVDGVEKYYRVVDKNVLADLAKLYAGEENFELAEDIINGTVRGFLVFQPDEGEPTAFPLLKGFQEIEKSAANLKKSI